MFFFVKISKKKFFHHKKNVSFEFLSKIPWFSSKFQFYEESLKHHKIMTYDFFFLLEDSSKSWDFILTKFKKKIFFCKQTNSKFEKKIFHFLKFSHNWNFLKASKIFLGGQMFISMSNLAFLNVFKLIWYPNHVCSTNSRSNIIFERLLRNRCPNPDFTWKILARK